MLPSVVVSTGDNETNFKNNPITGKPVTATFLVTLAYLSSKPHWPDTSRSQVGGGSVTASVGKSVRDRLGSSMAEGSTKARSRFSKSNAWKNRKVPFCSGPTRRFK